MTHSLAAIFVALTISSHLIGETSLRIAVASNFQQTLAEITDAYQQSHPDTTITLIPGSSGKLYAQIANGAPFDAFFSADGDRPRALEKDGHAPLGSRFTFALGILALWQPGNSEPDLNQAQILATANPKLAPFGRAAEETLANFDFTGEPPRLIQGTSATHAFNFVHSGAADTGLVSYSQLRQLEIPPAEYRIIDSSHHSPIDQQAIAISSDEDTAAFLRFCQSDLARRTILEAGYRLPDLPTP